MPKKKEFKLVRDKIPELVSSDVEFKAITDDKERAHYLFKKLNEECEELKSANEETRAEEMADVLEVLGAIMKFYDISSESVFKQREEKEKSRGSFNEFIIMELKK